MTSQEQSDEPKRKDPRFREQLALAAEGKEEAVSCLWSEFGYDYRTGKFSDDSQGVDGDEWIEPEDEGGQV